MEMIPSERTISIICEHISKIGINLPLKTEEDIEIISEYFEKIELQLSNDLTYGEKIDKKLLDEATIVNVELTPFNSDDYIDLDKLNQRLMKNLKNIE